MFDDIALGLAKSLIYDFSKTVIIKTTRKESVQKVLRQLGASLTNHDFTARYVESLVELRLENKDPKVLSFFRNKEIMQVFFNYYYGAPDKLGNESLLKAGLKQCICELQVGDDIKETNLNVDEEVQHFWSVYRQKIQESRMVNEVELVQKVNELGGKILNIDEKVMQLLNWMTQDKKDMIEINGEMHSTEESGLKTLISQYFSSINKIPHNLTLPPFHPDVFLGREDELVMIHDKLFFGDHLLLLVNGEGGIGKTSLASKYFHKYQNEYEHVAWVFSEKNIANALLILAIPLGIKFEDAMPATDRMKVLLLSMAELKKPCLLIIDNANEINDLENNYLGLRCCSNFHLLITSRIAKFERAECYHIDCLSENDAIILFQKHYPRFQPSEVDLFKLIRVAVGGNTLVLELLAKNLCRLNQIKTHYSLYTLLLDIRNKGLLQLSQTQEIGTDYKGNGAMRYAKPEDIIASIYDLGELSSDEIGLLSIFAILPAESIEFEILETLMPDSVNLEHYLQGLAQKGWIEFNTMNSTFKVNPVVQAVTKQKNKNIQSVIKPLVEELIKQIASYELSLNNSSFNESLTYTRYAESIIAEATLTGIEIILLCKCLGYYYQTNGNLGKALDVFTRGNELCIAQHDSDPMNPSIREYLAMTYTSLGGVNILLGNFDMALIFYKTSNTLLYELYKEFEDAGIDYWLVKSFIDRGITYTSLRDLDQAISHLTIGNELLVKLYEGNSQDLQIKIDLASSYGRLGITCYQQGNLGLSLVNFENQNSILKELYKADPQNITHKNNFASSISNLGEMQFALGCFDEAIGFAEIGHKLSKELHEEYPKEITYKNNLALSYATLAIYYQAKGIKTAQTQLFFQHAETLWLELLNDCPDYYEYKISLNEVRKHLKVM